MVFGDRTCLCNGNDLVIVAVACSLEVLWELCGLATARLAHDDSDGVALDSIQQGILVTSYRQ